MTIRWSFSKPRIYGVKKLLGEIRISDFGRVLELKNLQKRDSMRVICTASNVNTSGEERTRRITSLTFLKGKLENLLLHGCGSGRSEYRNPPILLVHERSDIFRIARSEGI